MNPAEIWAALRLLEHAIKAAAAGAQQAAEDYRQQVRAKSLETDWGQVYVTRRKPAVVIADERRLVDWCEANAPHLVTRTVSPAAQRALVAERLAPLDGGEVVDTQTGEVVDFASVRPGGESLTYRPTAEAKAEAEALIGGRVEQLAALLRPGIGAGDE